MGANQLKNVFTALSLVQTREDSSPDSASFGDLHGFEFGHGMPFQFSPMLPNPKSLGVGYGQAAQFAARAGLFRSNSNGAGGPGILPRAGYDPVGSNLPVEIGACLDLEPCSAGRMVVVLHQDAFRIGQAAPVGNHPVGEHGRIPTGGPLFGKVYLIGVWPQSLDESGRIDMALPVRQLQDVLAVIAQAVPDIEIGLAVLLLVGDRKSTRLNS